MKLAVLMDSLADLNPSKDTTVALIKCANVLGWSCVYFTVQDVYCQEGRAYAHVSSITILNETATNWAKVSALGEVPLSAFDIILMRKDPPFDLEYIYATYALELAEKEGVLISNRPQSLRDANEKFFTLQVPQCCPPTLVSRSISRLRAFWELHQEVIFKPLSGMGGRSVFHVGKDGQNVSVILELLTASETTTIMAQRYIPAIKSVGDKRILLIHGEPVPFALARIPAEGELRGNLAAGARGEVVPLTIRDQWICAQIAPLLQARGLHFVGIDVIGNYLTEVNVTSPTCLREITADTQLDIAGDYLRGLERLKLQLPPRFK